jgi:hypothetical protein
MTPWGRNMQMIDLFYKAVFNGHIFIHFTVQHNGMHNLKKQWLGIICQQASYNP